MLLDHLAPALSRVEQVERLDAGGQLEEHRAALVALVRALLARDDVDPLEVAGGVALVDDALTRRLLVLAEAELGPPPCPYAWLVLGSQGRGEQVLSSDQDSALAFRDPLRAAEEYFPRLAGLVVDALVRAGLPRCPGGYTATEWCRPVQHFARMFSGWVDSPEPSALVRAEVFLDVRRVHGDLPVDALEGVLVRGGTRGPFRAQLARAAVAFRPPLGLFGRLRPQSGTVDVKTGGTAAVVLLARLYGLTAGSSARGTVQRLQDAASAATLHAQDARALADAYRLLVGLRLRHQAAQLARGARADDRVPLDELTADEQAALARALRAVRDVQQATVSRFSTDMVT